MRRALAAAVSVVVVGSWLGLSSAFGQDGGPPTLRAAPLAESVTIDGVLDEAAWGMAETADAFTQTDPVEDAPPTGRTLVKVLAGPKVLVIGIACPGLREWHFNVQRRIQRLLETDRWASPNRQYQVTQTSRAGASG